MFSFRYTSGACKQEKTIVVQYGPKNVSSKLSFISSPNIAGFYRFIFHKVV